MTVLDVDCGVCRNSVGAWKADRISIKALGGAYIKSCCPMEQAFIVRVSTVRSWRLVQKFSLESQRISQSQQIQLMNSMSLNPIYLSQVPTIAQSTSGKTLHSIKRFKLVCLFIGSRATGICGSDVHFWKHGSIGESVITKDCGLGHESSGIVVKVGKNVKTFGIGM